MAIANSYYCFILPNPFLRPTTKLKGRQPLPGTDRGHLRLQTPCTYHLTTVAIADSSYFFTLPNLFFRPTTKLKGLQPPAGTDPGHLDFKHLALTTVAIADKIQLFYSSYSFSLSYNEAKRPPATGRDRSWPRRVQTPCTYHLTTVAIADKILLFYSAYSFSPPYNEAKRPPATGRDRSRPLRLQTPFSLLLDHCGNCGQLLLFYSA